MSFRILFSPPNVSHLPVGVWCSADISVWCPAPIDLDGRLCHANLAAALLHGQRSSEQSSPEEGEGTVAASSWLCLVVLLHSRLLMCVLSASHVGCTVTSCHVTIELQQWTLQRTSSSPTGSSCGRTLLLYWGWPAWLCSPSSSCDCCTAHSTPT